MDRQAFDQISGSSLSNNEKFKQKLLMNFGDFVLGGNEKSNSNSRKSLVKSILSESMEGYHSQENGNVVDLEYNETSKK